MQWPSRTFEIGRDSADEGEQYVIGSSLIMDGGFWETPGNEYPDSQMEIDSEVMTALGISLKQGEKVRVRLVKVD